MRLIVICFLFECTFSGLTMSAPPTIDAIQNAMRANEVALFENSQELYLQFTRTAKHFRADFVIAHSGDQWRTSRKDIYSSPNEETRMWVSLLNDGITLEWRENERTATIMKPDEMHNLYTMNYYFRNLGYDINARIAKSADVNYESERRVYGYDLQHPFVPNFLAANKDKYEIQDAKEIIDGHPCWVMEWPGVDKLWIDESIGFHHRLREYTWETWEPKSDDLRFRIRQGDFFEPVSGLWIPREQVSEEYSSTEGVAGQLLDKSEYRLNTFAFKTPSAALSYDLPTGVVVLDKLKKVRYRVGSPDEVPYDQPFEDGDRVPVSGRRRTLIWINVVMIIALIVAVFIKRFF